MGGETKFACVDGPHFDGHKVDFDELMQRNTMYSRDERTSLLTSIKSAVGGGGEPERDRDKVFLEGAELSTFCPHCHQGLIVFDPTSRQIWVRLAVFADGKKGELLLSPKFDAFEQQLSFELGEDRVVDDVLLPPLRDIAGRDSAPVRSAGRPRRGWSSTRNPGWSTSPSARSSAATGTACRAPTKPRSSPRCYGRRSLSRTPCCGCATSTRSPMVSTASWPSLRRAAAWTARSLPVSPVALSKSISPGFVRLIKAGEFVEAARLIKQKNALPAVCGRVCPQDDQCEKLCILGKKEEPVAIGALERFAADFERETDAVTIPRKAPATGKRIAVVGSGPAGLTLAADLVAKGHSVTIFESLHKAGGVLVYGIPEFRLPKSHRGGRDRLPAPPRRQDRAQLHRRPALHASTSSSRPATTRSSSAPGPACRCS